MGHIERGGARTDRADGALRERISGLHKGGIRSPGFEAEPAFSCCDRPERMIGIVVPLPNQWQRGRAFFSGKFVGCGNTGYQALTCGQVERFGRFAMHP